MLSKAKSIPFRVLYLDLLTREIPVGLPPHSSNTTNKFPLGFSHDRGTWYLKFTSSRSILMQVEGKKKYHISSNMLRFVRLCDPMEQQQHTQCIPAE